MTWKGFDPTPYTREQFATHVASVRWNGWRPEGITLHNTAGPTLAQWAESGPNHDARLRNLESYYEQEKGWHAGPHAFISRSFINGFSDLSQPGIHSTCFNHTHLGLEMVGDYNVEEFDSGDGALVRDNAVFALATLYRALELSPDGLVFHVECTADNHDCPGRKVHKADVIERVKAAMGLPATVPAPAPAAAPWDDPAWRAKYPAPRSPELAWVQLSLNRVLKLAITVDGLDGSQTQTTVSAYQRLKGLHVDGIAGDLETIPSLKAAVAAL